MLTSLWLVTFTSWAVLAIGAEICVYLFDASRFAVPCSYAMGMCCFYLWHLMAHRKWTVWPLSAMHADHMEHHWRLYPPTPDRYLSDTALHCTAGRDKRPAWVPSSFPDIEHELPLYLMCAISLLLGGRVVMGVAWVNILTGFVFICFAGQAMLFVHESVHIRHHYLCKYEWFEDLRAVHLQHHKGSAKTNYGMYSMLFDYVLGTYHDPVDDVGKLLHAAEALSELDRYKKDYKARGTAEAKAEGIRKRRTMFDSLDLNHDGSLSFSELKAALQKTNHSITDAEVEEFMSKYDADGDGSVSLNEFFELDDKVLKRLQSAEKVDYIAKFALGL